MSGALKFFGNALKAIFLSPFYIAYFAIFLVICVFNYINGEVRALISGFKYASIKENIYEKQLLKYKTRNGDQ